MRFLPEVLRLDRRRVAKSAPRSADPGDN